MPSGTGNTGGERNNLPHPSSGKRAGGEGNNLPSPSGRGAGGEGRISHRWKWFAGQLVALLLAGAIGFALGIMIRIKKDGQTTTIEVPEGSNSRIAADGSLDVALPEKSAPPPASAAAKPINDLKSLYGMWKIVRIEKGNASTWQASA